MRIVNLEAGTYCKGPPYATHESWLIKYIHQCKTGEVIVGHEIMLQMYIFLKNFEDEDITIDFTQSNKRIKFIETKCKHYEAPFAGKAFILLPFQKAFIESIYCFLIWDDEARRLVRLYQEILFLVGRKNGKTPLIGAIAFAEFFCGPKGIKILCSSNDYEQADLMFQAINNMREESPSLEKLTRKNIKGIFFGNPKKIKKKGKFSYQNKGSIRKMSAKSGAKEGRNIGVGVVDECHEMKDHSTVMPVRQALSTQEEPLYFELTTEGVINDGYLDARLIDARKVLNGELDRPRWNIWLYTQDKELEIWQDEESWYKSNPGLGIVKKRSFLRKMIEEAQGSKPTRVFVLSKDFNIKQNNASAWLTPEDIENGEVFDIEEFRNSFALGGVDLARTGDLCSARAMFMRPNSNKKYFVQQYFIPESKLDNLSKDDLAKYKEWIRLGLMTVSEGNENDFRLVTQWFYSLYKDYGIRFFMVGYDKWSANYWVKEMESYGFDCKRIDQNFGTMSDPMKLLEVDLKSNMVVYNNHPIDKMCLENTAVVVNNREEIMPIKGQGQDNKKIDGSVTMIITYRVYIDNRTEFLDLVKRG